MQNERGSATIIMALVLGIIGVAGVYALHKRVVAQRNAVNVNDSQEMSRNANQSATVYAKSLLTIKDKNNISPNDTTLFPNVYVNNYFAPLNEIRFSETPYGDATYANVAADCKSQSCILKDTNIWSVLQDGSLRINARGTSPQSRSNLVVFYQTPTHTGLPGQAIGDDFSYVSIAGINRDSNTQAITSLELQTSSTAPKLGLLSALGPSTASRFRLNLDLPPPPLSRTIFTDSSGASPTLIYASDPFKVWVQTRGIASKAYARVDGLTNPPSGCTYEQSPAALPPGEARWQPSSFKKYASNAWDTAWNCQYGGINSSAIATINVIDPNGPSPTNNYQIYYNVASVNKDSNPHDPCTTGRRSDGYCNNDIPGSSVAIVKRPNCRMNIGYWSSNENDYNNNYRFDFVRPWNVWAYLQIYGMVFDSAQGGAKIHLTKWQETSANPNDFAEVGIYDLQNYRIDQEATDASYDSLPGGRSPQNHQGRVVRFGRWAENKNNMPNVKGWLTMMGSMDLPVGAYQIFGEVTGPGGVNYCDIPAQAGAGSDPYWVPELRVWGQVNITSPMLFNTSPLPGQDPNTATAIDYAGFPVIRFTAQNFERCLVRRLNDSTIMPTCDWTAPGRGSFDVPQTYECMLDRNIDHNTRYAVECSNPTASQNSGWGTASYTTPLIRRWCYASGGPTQAAYISRNAAERTQCGNVISSAAGALCSPSAGDCNDMSREGKIWCPVGVTFDPPSTCRCFNPTTAPCSNYPGFIWVPGTRF